MNNQYNIDSTIENQPHHGVYLVRSNPSSMQKKRVLVKTFRFEEEAESYADTRNATARPGEYFTNS